MARFQTKLQQFSNRINFSAIFQPTSCRHRGDVTIERASPTSRRRLQNAEPRLLIFVEQDGTSSSHHRNRNRLSLGASRPFDGQEEEVQHLQEGQEPSRQQGAQEDEEEVLQEEEIAEGEEKAQDLQKVEKEEEEELQEEESAEEKEVQEKEKGKEGQEIQEVQEEDLQTKEENEKAKKVHS